MENLNALEYGRMCAESILRKYTPETLPPANRFHYHQGVFLTGLERMTKLTGDERYHNYIKGWADYNIDQDGNAPTCDMTEFDDIQPGMILFYLFDTTGDRRYKIMLDKLNDVIEKWPTNAKGGIWHKYRNKNQMWLDTMYMMGVFTVMYATRFNNPYMYDKIYTQMKLMHDNMTNPQTGLMYHMWDDSRRQMYVDKETGLVKVHWGRAMSWYVAALAEFIEYAPKDSRLCRGAVEIVLELLKAVKKYQDPGTGMWYQLLDKVDDKRNWQETSCTSLFTYAAAKLYRLGIIGDEYNDMIVSGYNGALSKTENDGEALIVSGVCVGTGVGWEEYYLNRPTIANDLHGAGAFLLMCSEIYRLGRNI